MDINEQITQLLSRIPGAMVEKTRFGRSERVLFWVSLASLKEIARLVRAEAGFDVLENLSAMQVDESLVFTYVAMNSTTHEWIVLRGSAELTGDGKRVPCPSVSEIWPMARNFEQEISPLFGVAFDGVGEGRVRAAHAGFPLRKDFQLPKWEAP